MSTASYMIRVSGAVPAGLGDDFDGVWELEEVPHTLLHADLADAAALHGLLRALRRAGLELLEVRRELPPEPPPETGCTAPPTDHLSGEASFPG